MKKTIAIIACLLVVLAAAAQQHMEFMEVTLGQSVDSFVVAMEQKGFKPYITSKTIPRGYRHMVGEFNGNEVRLVISYGVHTMQVTNVQLRFAEIKDLGEFLNFYAAMKRVIVEQYCTEGEAINEPPTMESLPKYGMKMEYGTVMVGVNPNTAYVLTLTYTDDYNTLEERKRRWD